MSRPVFLAESLEPRPLVLTGAEGRHAATVRRLRVGEQVDVVDGRGGRAVCTVTAVGRDVVELDVLQQEQEPPAQPRLVLVQALAKGDRGELAVELATEVGVDEVVPWAAERCVVRWDGPRGEKALERWRSTSREAGKQSRRSWLPVVGPHVSTTQVVERARAAAVALVLHEAAELPLATAPLPADGEVLLVVGPEGGLTERELTALTAAGGLPVRLGRSVLRTSSAGAVAAAVVSARTTRWA
jgi:16S rRNA (uracil1498-N3)-methyltransferase